MPESLWEKSCQVSDPGDGTPLPPHSFYLDRACSSHNCRKKENPNNYHIPGSVARASKGMGGGWRDIRTLVQFPDRGSSGGAEFREPGLRSRGDGTGPWAGSYSYSSFSEPGGSWSPCCHPLQPSLLWLHPSLQFTSENGTQACPSPTWALPP